MSDKPLVIYHGQCKDGFCSAWVFHRKYGDKVEFHEGVYGQPPPDVQDRDVYMVDFCYPLEVMQVLATKCRTMQVLDHHVTAAEAMEGFQVWIDGVRGAGPVNITFDMDRSGARLAWNYCNGYPTGTGIDTAPWLVDYVQDRDLWRHKLPDSMAINAYISTLEFSFYLWDAIYDEFKEVDGGLVSLGKAILSKTEQYVREVRKNARRIKAGAWDVPIVNAPQIDVSELGYALCEGEPFSIAWWQRADGMYQYSLRSREGSTDVSLFAKAMGGGGHKHAAGFVAPKPPGPGTLGNLGLNPAVG